MTNTASIWLKGRPPAEGTMTLIKRLKAGMYDVPQSTAELLQEAIDALESAPKQHPNVLREVSSEWQTEKNAAAVTVHHRMIEGVLCRWWGDGPTPKGVAMIDRALESAPKAEPVIPREPTEAMMDAAIAQTMKGLTWLRESGTGDTSQLGFDSTWRAMYDAAPLYAAAPKQSPTAYSPPDSETKRGV